MKKLLLSLCCLAVLPAMAQLEQGNIYVSGVGSYSSSSGETINTNGGTTVTMDNPKTTMGTLGVGAGYFIADGFSVGLGIGFGNTTTTDYNGTDDTTDDVENKSGSFSIGIFARKYAEVAGNFYLFGQLGVGIGSSSSETTAGNTTVKGPDGSSFGVNLSPGFTFFPTNRIGLDVTLGNLGVNTEKLEAVNGANSTEVKSSDFDLTLDLTAITFGVQVFFGGNGGNGAAPSGM